jgi:hypothetical protein
LFNCVVCRGIPTPGVSYTGVLCWDAAR